MPICHIYDEKICFLSHISDFISCDIGIAFAVHSLIVFMTRNKNPNAAKALLGIFKEISSNTWSLQCQLSLPSASNDGMHWADLWGHRRTLKLGVVRFNGEEKGLRHGEYRYDLREAFTADTVSVHVQYFISNLENTRFGLKNKN